MKKKKILATLLSTTLLFGSLPVNVLAEKAVELIGETAILSEEFIEETATLSGITVKEYSDSLINTFRLQSSSFANDGSSHSSNSVGKEIDEKRSGSNTKFSNSNSSYPLGYRTFWSSNQTNNDPWNQWMRWKMDSNEKSLFSKLTATSGNIQVGGRYSGFIDTQAGCLAGKAYMGIELKNDSSSSSTRISYKETKMSGDESKDTQTNMTIGWQDVASNVNAIYIQVGGTKGNTFGKNRNYAAVHYPEVFIKDNKAPTITSSVVTGGYSYNSNQYFSNGDKIGVTVYFSEPIRCTGDDFNSAFSVTMNGIKFNPIEYNEVDYSTAQLTFEATVGDSTEFERYYNAPISIRVNSNKVSDLAGNVMSATTNSPDTSDVVISGLLPRITRAEITKAFIKDADGIYDEERNVKNAVKPGDYLVFRLDFNQLVQEYKYSAASTFPIEVGSSLQQAYLYAVHNSKESRYAFEGSSITDRITYEIDDSFRFNAVEYIVQVPSDVSDGEAIYIPAEKKNGKWYITADEPIFNNTFGNLYIDEHIGRRKPVQQETAIVAQDDETTLLQEMYIDAKAPTIRLTDRYGNDVEGIYSTAEEADITSPKSNSFRVYFQSDELVYGKVKLKLKYAPKDRPLDITTINIGEQGAYINTDELDGSLEDMYLDIDLNKMNLNIDSADYDVYLETTASDELYNKKVQNFYLAVDTAKPTADIVNGNGNGELVSDGMTSFWDYQFDVNDRSTPENMRLYYRWGGEGDFLFTDDSSAFNVKTQEITSEEELAGTIEYYAEDGSDNVSETKTANYYISDARVCYLRDPEDVEKYLEPRDVYFTGFEAPEETEVGYVYDFLVYCIDNGEFRYIRNDDGSDIAIPAAELQENHVITYKLIRSTEEVFDVNSYAAQFSAVYHCDNSEPGADINLSYDEAKNVVAARIMSPADVAHPRNITSAEFTLSNGKDTIVIDGSEHIRNGMLYTALNLTEILDTNSLSSGMYTLNTVITDENGHVTEVDALEGGKNIIIHAPQMTNIKIKSAHDAPFDDSIGAFAQAADTTNPIAVTADSVRALIESGLAFTPKADEYQFETELKMRYVGTEYPRLSDNDVLYTISDDGENWTEYAPAELESSDAEIIEEDGITYAVYKVNIPVIKNKLDASAPFKLRLRCGANVYPSDIAIIETRTDTTAPDIAFIVDAVGSDETGWSTDINYTSEQVRYRYAGIDSGFLGTETTAKITKLLNENGDEVAPENYNDYVYLQETDEALDYIIFRKRCHLYATVSDFWGNTTDTDFECLYIDDVPAEYRVYNENTDEFAYVVAANVADVKFGAVTPGTLEMTDEAISAYDTLYAEGIVIPEYFGSMRAIRDGEIHTAYRFRQAKLALQDYDLIGAIYDLDGNVVDTFKIMPVISATEEITLLSTSNTARELGKTIHAVETMLFNVPVAQVEGEAAILLAENIEAAQEMSIAELSFSTTLNAVLDINTGGDVYVIDRFGRGYHISVDTEGTEFIEYAGHTISYREKNDIGSIERNADFIYGENSAIEISISGNSGIAAMKPELSTGFNIGAASEADTSGTEYEGYYDELVIEAAKGFTDCEGTMLVTRFKVKNKTNLEEYNDAIVIRTDNTAPVLLDKLEMRRPDKFSPVSVMYLFYDRYGIASVRTDNGDGFVDTFAANGISYARYISNGKPVLEVTDKNGNTLITDGITVDDIVKSDSLIEGRDYKIEVLDENRNPVEEGKYYSSVYARVVPIEGGKHFVTSASESMLINSEEDVIFELVDDNGQKVLNKFAPPVDVSAPNIIAVQDNSGEFVAELHYSISVSERRSGIAKVYIVGGGENGEDIELEKVNSDSLYSHYTFVAHSSDDFVVVAVDNTGNISEATLSSNSLIVGPLEVEMKQSITGITNKNVTIALSSKDGRRIYTHIPDTDADGYLSPADYIVSGNEITFLKNGTVAAECTDEAGNREMRILTVSNIDKEPPLVTGTVEDVIREDGTVSPTTARIRFKAQGEDDRPMAVILLYVEKKPGEGDGELTINELKRQWNEYKKNPEQYIMTDEFKELFDKLFKLDITDEMTYAEVTENGIHTFYVMDTAGNIGEVLVEVTSIDDIRPEILGINWGFNASPGLSEAKEISGSAEASLSKVEISKAKTGYLTNSKVEVALTVDEPVRIFGSNSGIYSTMVKNMFTKNGIYSFAIEDEAGNISEKTIDVSNIDKKELFIEYDGGEIILFEGQEADFKPDTVKNFRVYTYGTAGEKVYLDAAEYEAVTDYGGLNVDSIKDNAYDIRNPYIITYKAGDNAGNRAERTRRVILAGNTDTVVLVNGNLPNSASCVYTEKDKLDITVANYDKKAVVKVAPGQLNAAQMKHKSGELTIGEDGLYHFTPEAAGWYTIGVRTLYQDIFVVWVCVS